MIFNYSDEEERLSPVIRRNIERAAVYAVSSELGLSESELDWLDIELSVTIVSAEEIREINAEYRGIDKVTDVLSFPQYDNSEEIIEAVEAVRAEDAADGFGDEFGLLLGDVVICYDRALEQAEEYGTGADREIVYLATHSVFHLLGYDHMEEEEKRTMRAREEEVMSAIGLARD